jgi:hypothetical protein
MIKLNSLSVYVLTERPNGQLHIKHEVKKNEEMKQTIRTHRNKRKTKLGQFI